MPRVLDANSVYCEMRTHYALFSLVFVFFFAASSSSSHTRLDFAPTSIFYRTIPRSTYNTSVLSHYLIEKRVQDKIGTANRRSTRNGWRLNLDGEEQEPLLVGALFDLVEEFYRTALKELGWRKTTKDELGVYIKGWANILDRGGLNVRHNHPNCHLSGVFYAKAPIGAGKLRIYSPQRFPDSMDNVNPDTVVEVPLRFPNRLSSSMIDLRIEDGLLVLFPAYLVHEVIANEAQEERISVAFNILPLLNDTQRAAEASVEEQVANRVDEAEAVAVVGEQLGEATLTFGSIARVDMRAWAMDPHKFSKGSDRESSAQQ